LDVFCFWGGDTFYFFVLHFSALTLSKILWKKKKKTTQNIFTKKTINFEQKTANFDKKKENFDKTTSNFGVFFYAKL